MKGIILAAGSGTRLSPATLPISKILLPVYDRPMIYYPLSILMSASIKDILVITNKKDSENFKRVLGDGSQFGIKIDYLIQYVQRGISDAFIIAEEWISGERVALILGDNIFYGDEVEKTINEAIKSNSGAMIFGYRVPDPRRFGVVEFDEEMKVISIEEKPEEPKSDYVAVGLYLYDEKVCSIAKTLKPSKRGELEITDLNIQYLEKNDLSISVFTNETKWIDAGTFDSILESSSFIANEEKKQDKKILCPEIIAYKKGFVTKETILKWLKKNSDSEYFNSISKEIDN